MQISDFDYDLPEELIAQQPLAKRDASRMLVVHRADGSLVDSSFAFLPNYLRPEDVLVLNNTRVFPARLSGERMPTGGVVELLLLREIETHVWEALARPGRRLRKGARISFGSRLVAEVMVANPDGTRLIRFDTTENLRELIDEIGQTPLPPYIKRDADARGKDFERYQTVYARERGASAAPTAGLHFTSQVLGELANAAVKLAEITLHVGYGTFEPVRVNEVVRHRVAPERFSISDEAARLINQARQSGGRVVAVGTTTARALESAALESGEVRATTGLANLTVIPGYEFRTVDVLLTNFHLPKSSLLLLVSAFAGRELVLDAYRHA
ncbi:MAG: tRNA preQ1(34) S-adenosylmethionine ribosyltransferase-isomerase QueA, partial [Pyrinomonadaceae bacterium]